MAVQVEFSTFAREHLQLCNMDSRFAEPIGSFESLAKRLVEFF